MLPATPGAPRAQRGLRGRARISAAIGAVFSCACSAGGSGTNAGPTRDSGPVSSGGSPTGSGGASQAGAPSGGSGGVGVAPGACAGQFGAPSVVLTEGKGELASPSILADELELFYVDRPVGETIERFMRAQRAAPTGAFGPGGSVAELNAQCPSESTKSIDVTDDGLRAYLSCGTLSQPQVVYFAHRSDRGATFQVDTAPIAQGVGLSFAVSADELAGYASSLSSAGSIQRLTRTTKTAPFGAPGVAPGLEATPLSAPDVSNDDLLLVAGESGQLAFSTRALASDPWGSPKPFALGPDVYGAPVLAANCRALYLVHVASDGTFTIEMLRR